jgi:hypothetical protein
MKTLLLVCTLLAGCTVSPNGVILGEAECQSHMGVSHFEATLNPDTPYVLCKDGYYVNIGHLTIDKRKQYLMDKN